MESTDTTPAVETPTETVKPASKPRKAKKAKKPAKVAKPAKHESNGKHVKEKRLPAAQVRILKALSKAKDGRLPSAKIAERADVPKTHISGFTFFATKAKKSLSLVELGLARERIIDLDGSKVRLAEITAAGKKAVV